MTVSIKEGFRSNNRMMVLKSLYEDKNFSGKSSVHVRDSSDRTRLLRLKALINKEKKFITN